MAAPCWPRTCPQALAIYADVLRRPHLPEDQLEAGRLAMLQELRAVEDEPAQKVMMELRRRHYGEPWGRSAQGEQEALEATTINDVRGYFRRRYRPNGTILGVAGRIELRATEGLGGRIVGRLVAGRRRRHRRNAFRAHYRHVPYDSHQTQIGIAYASVPYRHPDYFQAFGAVGVLSGGMSARLFTEVRERRGLCYSVYATLHTLPASRGRVLLRRHRRRAGPGDARRNPRPNCVRLGQGIEEAELDRLKARIKSALDHAAGIEFRRAVRRWPATGITSAASARLDEVGRLIDALSSRSINAYLAEHPPADFTVVTLGSKALDMPNGEC